MKFKFKTAPFYVLLFLIAYGCSLVFSGSDTLNFTLDTLLELNISEPDEEGIEIVYEEGKTIVVYHGYACATSAVKGKEDILRMQERLDTLPDFVRNAAVFLNGWNLEYLDDDEHILGLGTGILNVNYDERDNVLSWDAFGAISDNDFEDSYRWCYTYTVVAWNPDEILIDVDQNEIGNFNIDTSNGKAEANLVRQMEYTAIYQNDNAALMPRGYAIDLIGGDEHLLQFGYHLDYEEDLIAPVLDWNSNFIFRDNDTKNEFNVIEAVSAVAGPDVNVINQDFTLEQWDDNDSGFSPTPQGTRTFTIDDIPYRIVIPMLTGWNIHYPDDQHLIEIGIQIEDFTYQQDSEDEPGRLTYSLSSVLRDNDNKPKFFEDHKISLLVMKPVRKDDGPATITSPEDNVLVNPATIVTFVSDVNDEDIDKNGLEWHSNIDGLLGKGKAIRTQLSGPKDRCKPPHFEHEISLKYKEETLKTIKVKVGLDCR